MEVAAPRAARAILAAGERDLGDLFMYNRSHAEAVAWLRRAADGFDRLGDGAGLSRTLDRLTFALYRAGRLRRGAGDRGAPPRAGGGIGDLAGVSIALGTTPGWCTGDRPPRRGARAPPGRRSTRRRRPTTGLPAPRRQQPRSGCTLRPASTGPPSRTACGRSRWRRRSGSARPRAWSIGNMGEVYRDEGDHVRATRCFAYALRIAARTARLDHASATRWRTWP